MLQFRDIEPILIDAALRVNMGVSHLFASLELVRGGLRAEVVSKVVLPRALGMILRVHLDNRWVLRRRFARQLGLLYRLAVLDDFSNKLLIKAAEALLGPLALLQLLLAHSNFHVAFQLIQEAIFVAHRHVRVRLRDVESNIGFPDHRQLNGTVLACPQQRVALESPTFLNGLRVSLPKTIDEPRLQPLHVTKMAIRSQMQRLSIAYLIKALQVLVLVPQLADALRQRLLSIVLRKLIVLHQLWRQGNRSGTCLHVNGLHRNRNATMHIYRTLAK